MAEDLRSVVSSPAQHTLNDPTTPKSELDLSTSDLSSPSPVDSPVLVAHNPFDALRSPAIPTTTKHQAGDGVSHPLDRSGDAEESTTDESEFDSSSSDDDDDEDSSSSSENDKSNQSSVSSAESSDNDEQNDDDNKKNLAKNLTRKPNNTSKMPSISVSLTPELPPQSKEAVATPTGAWKKKGAAKESTRPSPASGAAPARPYNGKAYSSRKDRKESRKEERKRRRRDEAASLQQKQHDPTQKGKGKEESRRERREAHKQQKKLAKKEQKAASRVSFENSSKFLTEDPLISAVPLSANTTRFQYKILQKDKTEFQQGSGKLNAETPDNPRRKQPQSYERPASGRDSPALSSLKPSKRRRAQSVLINGEAPAVPSKVLENYPIPAPQPRILSKPHHREEPILYGSSELERHRGHFKHLRPVFQSKSPHGRRRILHEASRGDYNFIPLSHKVKNPKKHAAAQYKADDDEETVDTRVDRDSLFQPRSSQIHRKRSRSLIETTPIEEEDLAKYSGKPRKPLVDIAEIMKEEFENKLEIPISPHISDTNDPEVPDDQSDISPKRFYVLGDSIAVEEDREHEFKAVQQTRNPIQAIAEHCKKYINAFLNTDGGTMYFGVEDDGRLVGVPMDRKTRDTTRLKIDGIVSQNHPQVDPHLITVDFVPVIHPDSRNHAQEILNDHRDVVRRFVVEVKILKGISPVYTNGDSSAYFRRSGSVYAMGRDMIDQRRKYGRPTLTTNVPDIPRDFVGREDEIAMIKTFATTVHQSPVKIVLLHGTPLVGKSSLARQLVLTLSASFPDRHLLIDLKGVSARYITTEEAKIGIIRVVYPLLKMPESQVEINGLYESCFAGLRCILLVENAGTLEQVRGLVPLTAKRTPMQNMKHLCGFFRLFSACMHFFRLELLMIVTSRKDLQLDSELDALSVRLSTLNEPNAIKLLLAMAGDRRNDISAKEASEICRLCGFLPLPLRIAGATLARNLHLTPSDLIKQFGDDKYRLELMSTASFHSAFDLYDPEIKKRLLAISVFPGTFDLEAAAAVLAEELVDAKISMQHLVELNEVEFDAASGRFLQNDLIRLYCQKRAEESASQLALWRQHFVRHYLRVLLHIVQLCESYIHRKQGVELFSLESHNIEACLALSFKTNNIQVCSRYIRLLRDFAPHMDVPALHKWQQLTHPLLHENSSLKELCNADMPQKLTMSDVYIANPATGASSTNSDTLRLSQTHMSSSGIEFDQEYSEMRNERPPTPRDYTPPPPSDLDEEFAPSPKIERSTTKSLEEGEKSTIIVQPTPVRPHLTLSGETSPPPAVETISTPQSQN